MPRKAKEELIKKENLNNTRSKKVKENAKNITKTTEKKNSSNTKTKKSNTSKKSSVSTKSTTRRTTKKTVSKSSKTTNSNRNEVFIEYYDLPNVYNDTIVKILAQTPSILFVYWDISEKSIKKLINIYGESFFNNTSPFLIVTNKSKNYSFEVEINDYANSWYVNISDADCKYDVSLIRKPKNDNIHIENNYVVITSSNDLQTPNDHILFENLSKYIFFKDVKSGLIKEDNISSLSFMKNIGRVYNIYDLYKEIYKNELKDNKLDEKITSSRMSS